MSSSFFQVSRRIILTDGALEHASARRTSGDCFCRTDPAAPRFGSSGGSAAAAETAADPVHGNGSRSGTSV
ncbi:MAG: hypothetical protein Q4F31_09740 [Eubacteriales bacterium]|nr:hypothetical protein [Eubacteriales bacterium]